MGRHGGKLAQQFSLLFDISYSMAGTVRYSLNVADKVSNTFSAFPKESLEPIVMEDFKSPYFQKHALRARTLSRVLLEEQGRQIC
jgi:hypothetical protein